jgi:hypothetical protein
MSSKYENSITEDGSALFAYGARWVGQTFTTSVPHTVTSVKLKLYRVGSLDTITVSIRGTSSEVPTGSDLCSVTIAGSTITTNPAGEWYEFTFDAGYMLATGTKYAIVVGVANGSYPDNYLAAMGTTTGYSGGDFVLSTNSGVSWNPDSTHDLVFEVWGDPRKVFSQSIIIG